MCTLVRLKKVMRQTASQAVSIREAAPEDWQEVSMVVQSQIAMRPAPFRAITLSADSWA